MVKMCSLVDYIEIIMPVILEKPKMDTHMTDLIIQMSGLFECETITKLLLDFKFYKVILGVIEL